MPILHKLTITTAHGRNIKLFYGDLLLAVQAYRRISKVCDCRLDYVRE